MNTATEEAIATADAHLNNVGLPTYTELLATMCDAAEINPFGDNHNSKTKGEARRLMFKARDEIKGEKQLKIRLACPAVRRDLPAFDCGREDVVVFGVSYACLDAEISLECELIDGELAPRAVRPYRVPKTRRAYGTLQAAVEAFLAAPAN